jgi:DUF4097 and DUF4098 domain-containing protein YvlB
MQTSRLTRAAASSLLVATLAASAAAVSADQSKMLDWSGDLASGTHFAVSGINGRIVADGVPGSHASVHAVAVSRLGDVSTVRLKVKQTPGSVVVCAVTPDQHVSDDCSISESVGHVDSDHAIRVDFTVHVPHGTAFRARTVNGAISIDGVNGSVDAVTVNGSIAVAGAAQARAKTVNGSIDASFRDTAWSGALNYATVNGAIVVRLPRAATFSVHARTLNGAIRASDFGLSPERRRFVGGVLDGTVGAKDGGRSLSLRTVNGSITIAAAP